METKRQFIVGFDREAREALNSSANPSSFGQAVKLTATVSPVTSGTPGAVTFKDGGVALCPAVAVMAEQATCTAVTLSPGAHTITAEYSGTAGWSYSAGTLTPLQQAGGGVLLPIMVK